MSAEVLSKAVNLLSFAALGLTILLIVRTSLEGQVRVFGLQSFVLALLSVLIAAYGGSLELLGVGVALVVVKGVVIPRVLNRAVANIGLQRAAAPYLGTAPALIICGMLTIIAFYVMTPIAASNPLPTADAIPLAFAGVLIGFFIMVNRRRAVTQILGFLMLENGIFLLALLATYGVPFIVEIGVFLDLLVGVLIMEVFVYRIKDNFDSIDVGALGKLKE
ncbi:MAG: hydrogenase [Deltaproteobacteria bacterium]|nr:hydrogenase [Deltaproteobacteria bacterium]MBI2227857.1 hydrogenase [Deltaproteobacteria bacterium]MBI3063374.1 hydrogenase [Deltaproteobacteria bacterium]